MPSKTFVAFISNLYRRCARVRTHLTQKLIPLNIHLARIGEATSPVRLKCNPNAKACLFVDQFPAYQQGKRTLEIRTQNRSPQNEMGAPYQCYWRALLTLSAFQAALKYFDRPLAAFSGNSEEITPPLNQHRSRISRSDQVTS